MAGEFITAGVWRSGKLGIVGSLATALRTACTGEPAWCRTAEGDHTSLLTEHDMDVMIDPAVQLFVTHHEEPPAEGAGEKPRP